LRYYISDVQVRELIRDLIYSVISCDVMLANCVIIAKSGSVRVASIASFTDIIQSSSVQACLFRNKALFLGRYFVFEVTFLSKFESGSYANAL